MREFVGFAVASRITWLLASMAIGFGSEALAQGPATPPVRVASDNHKCPSADFEGFLQAFSDSPVFQKRYTRLPLRFGAHDPDRIGEENSFKTSVVKAFEKMPNYDPESGTIYPTSLRMKEGGFKTRITTIQNSRTGKNVFPEETITDPRDATVLVQLPDTGVIVFYRFRKTQGCWFLYAISDRST